ncbi:hypothetical protein CCO03_18555 [Comamonas serinivorans]|uniref:Lipoprotein transmembrane n=1 Tax=Comamonas serinivorans TaxID=1082851 RepID=A0A1Y0ETH4_9BURK|nr:hypothetical protein CCO03_18555 [Comamonas serinivorans]
MPSARSARRGATALGLALVAGLLLGCASDPARLPLGSDRATVLERLGTPTAQYRLNADGGATERLQYSAQPAGQRVYNVDLNASGQVLAVTQAMDEAAFGRIQVDRWTRDDVLREFGPPFQITGVHAFTGEVWTWRYSLGPWNRLLHIYIDPQGVVRRWHPADEYLPDRVLGR